ncbi:unnamed protein product [Pleuronectes platessa]|uniref:Uncharacterized protein n=1 Tax=Pleuronectes platessa TaxID=8262 RepID=A0A9N7YZ23_PLEPL|nr:unnamed protein product [Pleuronectes platessa]
MSINDNFAATKTPSRTHLTFLLLHPLLVPFWKLPASLRTSHCASPTSLLYPTGIVCVALLLLLTQPPDTIIFFPPAPCRTYLPFVPPSASDGSLHLGEQKRTASNGHSEYRYEAFGYFQCRLTADGERNVKAGMLKEGWTEAKCIMVGGEEFTPECSGGARRSLRLRAVTAGQRRKMTDTWCN